MMRFGYLDFFLRTRKSKADIHNVILIASLWSVEVMNVITHDI